MRILPIRLSGVGSASILGVLCEVVNTSTQKSSTGRTLLQPKVKKENTWFPQFSVGWILSKLSPVFMSGPQLIAVTSIYRCGKDVASEDLAKEPALHCHPVWRQTIKTLPTKDSSPKGAQGLKKSLKVLHTGSRAPTGPDSSGAVGEEPKPEEPIDWE